MECTNKEQPIPLVQEVDIFTATKQNDLSTVISLLDEGFPIDSTDYKGFTLLHIACVFGLYDIVKELLKRQANVDKTDSDGFAALHFACNEGWLDCVELLLEYNARGDLETKDKRINLEGRIPIYMCGGKTPLHYAGI
eukprot:TRINITY_DN9972_c0_g1_i1.p1 TRINITY_DN9972_c0_g1~~TRINITY_DN9972_c0_g1_i1.p1  ORF type:complete len:138 (-),score=20.99 TRINITY_DN9972_c0_g1_i1:28-441(-)